jgi:hypothetical protein
MQYSRTVSGLLTVHRWVTANVALCFRDVAELVQRPRVQQLTVWLALLHEAPRLALHLRHRLGNTLSLLQCQLNALHKALGCLNIILAAWNRMQWQTAAFFHFYEQYNYVALRFNLPFELDSARCTQY